MRVKRRRHQTECGCEPILMDIEIVPATLVLSVEAAHEIAKLAVAWHGRFWFERGRLIAFGLRPCGIEKSAKHL